MEAYYLRVLMHWYRYKRSAPTLEDLMDLCRRSGGATDDRSQSLRGKGWPTKNAVRRGLLACETKGYARRNQQGMFEVLK
jgi:hypothetical protein